MKTEHRVDVPTETWTKVPYLGLEVWQVSGRAATVVVVATQAGWTLALPNNGPWGVRTG